MGTTCLLHTTAEACRIKPWIILCQPISPFPHEITLISCCMGADAYLVALTRISGIVGGVFVMLLLSVIIFPKSASHQVRQMRRGTDYCLKTLTWTGDYPIQTGPLLSQNPSQ